MSISIAVLYGGVSDEREVSLESGKCVYEALKKNFEHVQLIDVKEDFESILPTIRADVFYNILHGGFGEDGRLQKILERHHKKFTGSGSRSCEITMDKVATKELMLKYNIQTSPYTKFSDDISHAKLLQKIGLPMVVKPILGGSSVELYIVKTEEDLLKVPLKEHLFAEKFIKGREFTIGLLDGKAMAMIEIVTTKGVYDYESKYVNNSTQYLFDTVPRSLEEKMQKIAEKVYEISFASDMARVDFMLSEQNEPYVLELNSIPGMTSHSLLPKAAAKMGLSFEDLCKKITISAYQRR